MTEDAPRIHHIGRQFRHATRPNQTHIHDHLVLQQLHRAVHARQAIRGHGEEKRPPNPHARGAQTQRLDDVGGAPDAAVDEDGDAVLQVAFAQDGHDFGEDFDARPGEVELAPAVVGEDDAVDAGVDGAEDVFDALDAFQDDGHVGDGEEPGDVFPREGGIDEGGDGARGALGAVDVVAAGALHGAAGVVEFGAHVFLPAAELGCVDGDEEAAAAAFLGVLDDALGDGAVFVDVELQPLDLVLGALVDDLVEGAGGEGGDHLDDVVLPGAAGEDDFAFGVAEFAQGGGGDIKRDVDFGAEHAGGDVDVLDVDEDAGPEPDLVVGGVVLAHGDLVVGAGGVVCPRGLLHDFAGDGLEVHQVVAGFQRRHHLDALLPVLFFRWFFLFFLLHSVHVDLSQVLVYGQVLVQGIRRMDWLILFSCVFAGILQDDLGTTRVFWVYQPG